MLGEPREEEARERVGEPRRSRRRGSLAWAQGARGAWARKRGRCGARRTGVQWCTQSWKGFPSIVAAFALCPLAESGRIAISRVKSRNATPASAATERITPGVCSSALPLAHKRPQTFELQIARVRSVVRVGERPPRLRGVSGAW